MSDMTYGDACKWHASAQGLDPLSQALDAAGIEWGLWQSGGFCMVITVSYDAAGEYGITHDVDDTWIICKYEGGTEAEQLREVPWYEVIGVDGVIKFITTSPTEGFTSHSYGEGVKW